jgi:hypothetical protein
VSIGRAPGRLLPLRQRQQSAKVATAPRDRVWLLPTGQCSWTRHVGCLKAFEQMAARRTAAHQVKHSSVPPLPELPRRPLFL